MCSGANQPASPATGTFFSKWNELVEITGFASEENIEARNPVVTDGFYTSRSRARFVFRWQFANGKIPVLIPELQRGDVLNRGNTRQERIGATARLHQS